MILSPFGYIMIAGRALYLYLFLISLLVCVFSFFQQRRLIIDRTCGYLILYYITCILSALLSSDFDISLDAFREQTLVIVPFFLFSITYRKQESNIFHIAVYSASILIIVAMIFLQRELALIWNTRVEVTIGNTQINSNYLSFLLVFPFALCFSMVIRESSKISTIVRIFCLAICLVVLIASLWTGSRTCLIIIAINASVQFIIQYRKNKKAIVSSFIIIAISFIIINYSSRFLPSYIIGRLQLSTFLDSNGRVEIWRNTLATFFSNIRYILIGSGFGTTGLYVGVTAHNTYLQVLLENGIVGFTVYVIFTIFMFRRILKSHDLLLISLWFSIFIASLLMAGQACRFYWHDLMFIYVLSECEIDEGVLV